MKKLPAILLMAIGISGIANAGGSVFAQVQFVRIDQSGQGVVFFTQPLSGAANCRDNANYSNALAFDTNTAAGRSILAVVLAAKASGANVSAVGTGQCSIFGNWIEDWLTGVSH